MAGIAGIAGIALGILGTTFFSVDHRPDQSASLTAILSPSFSSALDTLASGETTAVDMAQIRPLSTFRVRGGTLCREVEIAALDRLHLVACRQDAAWQIRLIASKGIVSDGFTPAGSDEIFDEYLRLVRAGPVLSRADEREALATRESQ
jgi:hypothetical protein